MSCGRRWFLGISIFYRKGSVDPECLNPREDTIVFFLGEREEAYILKID
jgi:hypothetical protein